MLLLLIFALQFGSSLCHCALCSASMASARAREMVAQGSAFDVANAVADPQLGTTYKARVPSQWNLAPWQPPACYWDLLPLLLNGQSTIMILKVLLHPAVLPSSSLLPWDCFATIITITMRIICCCRLLVSHVFTLPCVFAVKGVVQSDSKFIESAHSTDTR